MLSYPVQRARSIDRREAFWRSRRLWCSGRVRVRELNDLRVPEAAFASDNCRPLLGEAFECSGRPRLTKRTHGCKFATASRTA
jgi:hypothetical protein